MAYDWVSGKLVMFGGFSDQGYLNDTWTFDGATWTKLSPAIAPPPRTASSMAFDYPSRKLVLFGGYSFGHGYFGDTWIFDGATGQWSATSPTLSPTAVTKPMAFPDPISGMVDVFGGFDGRFYQAGTFQWTGTTWIQLHPATSPSARSAGVTASNAAAKNVVLYGGLGDMRPDNTWTWDGRDWTQESPATQPPLVYDAGGAYLPAIQAPIIFGGAAGSVNQRTTWEWTGTDWLQKHPQTSPSPRQLFGMAFDEKLGHVILFGGGGNNHFLNDTWELDIVSAQ